MQGRRVETRFYFIKEYMNIWCSLLLDKGKKVEIGKDSGVTCSTKSTLQQYLVSHCVCVRKEQAIRS